MYVVHTHISTAYHQHSWSAFDIIPGDKKCEYNTHHTTKQQTVEKKHTTTVDRAKYTYRSGCNATRTQAK